MLSKKQILDAVFKNRARDHCPIGQYGVHQSRILGNPRSKMTYTYCSLCEYKEERGPGLFYGEECLSSNISALDDDFLRDYKQLNSSSKEQMSKIIKTFK